MSCVYKKKVIESELSRNARGGTEQMRDRLLANVDGDLLEKVAIHFSRPREIYSDVPNIMYCHDLAEDPENNILLNGEHSKFTAFVFVTHWQRDQYINRFGIPYSKCVVINNAIETKQVWRFKPSDTIRFIYHTTPHRGLDIATHVFSRIAEEFPNVHMDVFSSFGVYGWGDRDYQFNHIFDYIKSHPKMTYHGAQTNKTVLQYLEKAHVFLYPSTWKETSCIAMIEAIESGCVVVHPDYAALPETAAERTMMYPFTEDNMAHANRSHEKCREYMLNHLKRPGYTDKFCNGKTIPHDLRHDIKTFKEKWERLLSDIT
jgi:UDP-glucose:(glucosyl)LPS alpha-1,2-glucosyltransferase